MTAVQRHEMYLTTWWGNEVWKRLNALERPRQNIFGGVLALSKMPSVIILLLPLQITQTEVQQGQQQFSQFTDGQVRMWRLLVLRPFEVKGWKNCSKVCVFWQIDSSR